MKKLIFKLFGIIEISDTFKPKTERTEKQIYYDALLKLQNKIVYSGALKVKHLENGMVKTSLKLWK